MGNEKETHKRRPAPVYQESPPPGEPEPQPQPGPEWQPPIEPVEPFERHRSRSGHASGE